VGRRLRPVFAAGLLAAAVPAGAAWSPPPSPTRWVTDDASFLSPTVRDELDARLSDYAQQTGHQVLVYIAPTVGSETPEDFAAGSLKAWRVGRKGIDDGLILFIFRDEHQIRIEVGYGLEGVVPDLVASRIIREEMVPRIRSGDKDGGVKAGVEAVLRTIGGGTEGQPAPSSYGRSVHREAPPPQLSFLQAALLGVVGLLVLGFLVTHPSMALSLLWILSSRGSSGGWGGGGGFGGGGGGFSGGGGSSGGGGATGSW
jgi:uncharacterized protein